MGNNNTEMDGVFEGDRIQIPKEIELPPFGRVIFFLIVILIGFGIGGYYMGYTGSQDNYIESLEYYNENCICNNITSVHTQSNLYTFSLQDTPKDTPK